MNYNRSQQTGSKHYALSYSSVSNIDHRSLSVYYYYSSTSFFYGFTFYAVSIRAAGPCRNYLDRTTNQPRSKLCGEILFSAHKSRSISSTMIGVRQLVRGVSTSSVRLSKKNFRKFPVIGRGTIHDRERNVEDETFGQRMPYLFGTTEIEPELIPELIVPNLEGFKLKPYVSYNVPEVVQPEFTAEDLFEAIYSEKIQNDFRDGKLDEDGNPLEPSAEEKLSQDDAWANAKKTGADLLE